METDDMIFYKENDKIMSGGYKINSAMLMQGLSPITLRGGGDTESDILSLHQSLAIPMGLLLVQTNKTEPFERAENVATFDDDLYDRLFQLAEQKRERKLSRKLRERSGAKKSRKRAKQP